MDPGKDRPRLWRSQLAQEPILRPDPRETAGQPVLVLLPAARQSAGRPQRPVDRGVVGWSLLRGSRREEHPLLDPREDLRSADRATGNQMSYDPLVIRGRQRAARRHRLSRICRVS